MAANTEVDLGIWGVLTRLIKWLLFAAGVVAIVVWYRPLFEENLRLRSAIVKLDTEISREDALGKRLRASIEAVRRDPKTVERLARERFSYAKPGETVIRFDAPASNSAQPRISP